MLLQGHHATVQMRPSNNTGDKRHLLQRSKNMQLSMPAQSSGVLMCLRIDEILGGHVRLLHNKTSRCRLSSLDGIFSQEVSMTGRWETG